jgi:hypothetical protein
MVKLVDTRDLKSLDLKQVMPVRVRLRAPSLAGMTQPRTAKSVIYVTGHRSRRW